MIAFVAGLGPGAGTPARARVNPLIIIERQIHKPNMLVVLDTSGSLTGVPGGTFDEADEVGMDCDDGVNCRGGVSSGVCQASGKVCATDAHCRQGTCRGGTSACDAASNCPPVAGTCATGQACFVDGDCPAADTGRCAATGSSCNARRACSRDLRCKHGGASCSAASDCRPGLCADGTSTCSTDNDCPSAAAGGVCAWGTTPAGGCANAGQCPTRPKVCSNDSSRSCATASDCGICRKADTPCRSDNDCRSRNGDSCSFGGVSCNAPANVCMLPRQTCTLSRPDNACEDRNACVPDPNPCSGATAASCVPGTADDVCRATSTASGSWMCRLSLVKCQRDADCPASGDSCGPATSRFVIAKRTIRSVVSATANVVNLGFMTFHQSGYFPYYASTSGSTVTKSIEIKQGTLHAAKCYSKKTGLASTCTIGGTTYRLRGYKNARYLIKGKPDDEGKYEDANYCGWFCAIPGEGTGVFKGAYYEYEEATSAGTTRVVRSEYGGKTVTENGVTYRYFDARPDYYNSNTAPPISTVDCRYSCSATCGGRWDTQLAPFLSTSDNPEAVDAMVGAFTRWMEPASYGGLVAYGGTPIGCTLQNDGAPDRNHSAYHYMRDVKAADTLSCRQNFVLLITDGEANGPGDVGCGSSACAASDPVAAGCGCRAVLAAYRMRKELNVRTFVVGFSTDAAAGAGRLANENIAKAGGTDRGDDGREPYSFAATSEAELKAAIEGAIYQAVRGSYATSPASASQGTQQGNAARSGSYLLDARVDFPSWKGHLLAYDLSSQTPRLVWDAATKLEARDWKTRQVFTSNAQNQLVKVDVDPTSGAIRNKDALFALGLGATADEAEAIARWMLGDPSMKNPAVLGAIINSTPVDVGPPPDSPLPGGHEFHLAHADRPSLTYVGADDGMLHAFVTKEATVGARTLEAGSEAFAYLPPDMLPVVASLYAQGGQVADPKQHVFGIASSPKVKNMCVADCTDPARAVWKTLLVVTEGWGGNGVFMLDVTNPFRSDGGAGPFQVVWHSKLAADARLYGEKLGSTVSVPAFVFNQTADMADHRILFASGYPTDDGGETQGRNLLLASARDGALLATVPVAESGSCPQEYTVLTDVAASREQVKAADGTYDGRKSFLAAYFGDTWGTLWRYSPAAGLQPVMTLGCQHPLHFSPTVVQLDQDRPDAARAGEVFLVQVTNSALDKVTEAFEPSRMVIVREVGPPTDRQLDGAFGTGGQIVLRAGSAELCGVTDPSGETCLSTLPTNARPLSTPLAIPTADGQGFVLLSNWYAPAAQGCGKGTTNFLIHELSGSTVRLVQALKIADEPVSKPVLVSGKIILPSADGPVNITGNVTESFVPTPTPTVDSREIFQRTGWSEIE